jgi:hypothetical protein
MLRKFVPRTILVLAGCLIGSSFAQHSLTVDEIVQRHIDALGGRAHIDAVQSTITHAEYHEGNFVAPGVFIAKMRPYYRTICDAREKVGDVCEGYDGSAWEWYADPGVTLRVVGAAAAATRHGTEFMDSLVDYSSRGTQIQLLPPDVFGAEKVYKLHVTLADGFEKDLFVDQKSFLIVGDRRSAPVHAFGEAVRSENRIGDYREINGVLFPFTFTEVEMASGKEMNRLTVQSMEINPRLSAGFFAPPPHSPTPLQAFLERLYMERTDPRSLMWSYREFRAANPDVDTRSGVEFIGYQMAKMSDFSAAIELLKTNAIDYPKSASAQYGLGRAYHAAGKMNEARAAFEKALQIDPSFKKANEGLNALR